MLYAAKLQNLWENIIISFDFFTILIKELPNGRSKQIRKVGLYKRVLTFATKNE